MIQDTIAKIEARLASAEQLPEEKRRELMELVARLKEEVQTLSQTHADDARSIAQFAALSTHEATREEVKAPLLETSLRGLARSVQGFESSHPRLVDVVNRICTTLSNLGI
ncbi:DUF4404 domain-containing protein [Fontisphaera persica]|uniref:DUF4404 domain-containing protein n=1 Tax=Fontisphaera persica TaxID=2974023 RepID=UPI0024BF89DA|nr:DUF4404 domain-containing protein [Fontisphaera persica]WCJ61067.1 DUF4404 domain-containing protein [Fontisphaera persica]